eukprot:5672653-Prorocentrum_lima.AAC.1
MHPSLWLMIKGRKPEHKASLAEPVSPDKFAETHTWVKGQVKGRIALFVDDMLQTGAKASNVEFLKALERKWTMSKPEHLLKLIGVMINRQPSKVDGHEEGTFFVGQ